MHYFLYLVEFKTEHQSIQRAIIELDDHIEEINHNSHIQDVIEEISYRDNSRHVEWSHIKRITLEMIENLDTMNPYDRDIIYDALHRSITWDSKIKQYISTFYVNPNLDILNTLKDEMVLKIFYIQGNEEKRQFITSLFSRLYHIKNVETVYFNNREDYNIDMDTLMWGINDKMKYAVLLPDRSSVFDINKLVTFTRKHNNVKLFQIDGNDKLYEIKLHDRSAFIYKEVRVR